MFPCAANADMPDIGLFGVESRRDGLVCQPLLAKVAYLYHIILGQLGEWRGLSAMRRFAVGCSPRMFLVLLWSDVFEIRNGIISWIAVDVIDMVANWRRSYEGSRYELVDRPQSMSAVSWNRYAPVSSPVLNWMHQGFINATNVAQVADFVAPVASFDLAPVLVHAGYCNTLQHRG